jgi:hypothetical protein
MDSEISNLFTEIINETIIEGVKHEVTKDINASRPNYYIVFYTNTFSSGFEIGSLINKSFPMIIFSLEENNELSQYGHYFHCRNLEEIKEKFKDFLYQETLVKTTFYDAVLWLKRKMHEGFETEVEKTVKILEENGYHVSYRKHKTYKNGSDIMHYLGVDKNNEENILIGINANEKTGIIQRSFINIMDDNLKIKAKQIIGKDFLQNTEKDDFVEPFKLFNNNKIILVV